MTLTKEVREWLLCNAWAVKNKNTWFMRDFPKNQVPDNLIIPLNKRTWAELSSLEEAIAQREEIK